MQHQFVCREKKTGLKAAKALYPTMDTVLKEDKRGVEGEQGLTCYHVTEARFDLTLNTRVCTCMHMQAGSRGIKSHCVGSRSTERWIKDLRDVI